MIADLPKRLSLLFNFSKQASAVVASNFHEIYYIFQLFKVFNFEFVRLYLRH